MQTKIGKRFHSVAFSDEQLIAYWAANPIRSADNPSLSDIVSFRDCFAEWLGADGNIICPTHLRNLIVQLRKDGLLSKSTIQKELFNGPSQN